MKVACLLSLATLLLTVVPGCKKGSSDEPSERINNAPIVNAGNDTTIYFPVSTIDLKGTASDLDYDGIVEYYWQMLSGPSEIHMSPTEVPYTTVFGLNAPGLYEFQLVARDIRDASGHDRIKVTVAERPCSSGTNETILTDQHWFVDEWGGVGIPIDPLLHLPAKSSFKQIFIKLDSASDWIPVPPLDYGLPRPAPFYFQYYNGIANVFPNEADEIGESVDVKIVYCN